MKNLVEHGRLACSFRRPRSKAFPLRLDRGEGRVRCRMSKTLGYLQLQTMPTSNAVLTDFAPSCFREKQMVSTQRPRTVKWSAEHRPAPLPVGDEVTRL